MYISIFLLGFVAVSVLFKSKFSDINNDYDIDLDSNYELNEKIYDDINLMQKYLDEQGLNYDLIDMDNVNNINKLSEYNEYLNNEIFMNDGIKLLFRAISRKTKRKYRKNQMINFINDNKEKINELRIIFKSANKIIYIYIINLIFDIIDQKIPTDNTYMELYEKHIIDRAIYKMHELINIIKEI